jgi:hypothetical protein
MSIIMAHQLRLIHKTIKMKTISIPIRKSYFIYLLISFLSIQELKAQRNTDSIIIVRKEVYNGDTIIVQTLDEYILKELNGDESRAKYLKLVYNVKKTLPYAKLAAFRLQMMEDNLNLLPTKRAKDKYIKETEKAIKEEFQGKLLIKLVHRETGKNTYEILKGYRGSATSFYWNTFAKFYNADLRDEYDPIEDYQIEYIIKAYKLE